MSTPVNIIETKTGKLRPVCEFCGRAGRAVTPTPFDGRLSLFDIAPGWSEAPYPPDFVHKDGSKGSLWRCPPCGRRMDRGETLYGRLHVRDCLCGKWPSHRDGRTWCCDGCLHAIDDCACR